jgi:sugar lactone lactonase YvrE
VRLIVFLILLSSTCASQNVFPAIGSWREHLPYQNAKDVTASDNKIICATPYSLFSVDKSTKEVQRISKVSGLSETGISTINYDEISRKLFIAYTNSNIDVIADGRTINIPDIKRANLAGDKAIYQVVPSNDVCYLATGLGIIVLDANKYEVKESWFIGNSGGYVKTNAFLKANGYYYAATDEGLKKAAVTSPSPADFHYWQVVPSSAGLANDTCKDIALLNNKVVALEHDSLFIENGSTWTPFFSNRWPILSINASENKLFVSQLLPNGAAKVVVLNPDGTSKDVLQKPGFISYPKNGISVNGEYWIADLYGGLSHWAGNSFESYRLNSPQDVSSGDMAILNNTLYATAGSVNGSWNYQYNPNGVFKFQDGQWTNYNKYIYPQLDTMLDFISVAADPRDQSAWAGSFGGGLLHIGSTNQLQILKQNSPIGATVGDPGSYRVAGLAFDKDNNLWISNFGSTRQLHVLKNNGQWQSFSVPFFLTENAVSQIVVDDNNYKWIISPLQNGLIAFDQGSFDNPSDDRWRLLKTGVGSGNLPSNDVLSIAKDKFGYIWVGTSDGMGVIQCPDQVFVQGGCEAVLPVIQEGAFANYLFKGNEVRSIAVDGANRKWVATSTGAWLIAPDGDKVLAQFTEDNSPLLSSDVKKIAINGATGEVFFATAKGISSFRSDATEAEETKNNVLVFPNPVPPGYTGTIGIRGLPENSIVKITELNGRLVFQTRSLGGQAVWNGLDYKGGKAATGVYLVIAIDENGNEKVVTKIVFVKR